MSIITLSFPGSWGCRERFPDAVCLMSFGALFLQKRGEEGRGSQVCQLPLCPSVTIWGSNMEPRSPGRPPSSPAHCHPQPSRTPVQLCPDTVHFSLIFSLLPHWNRNIDFARNGSSISLFLFKEIYALPKSLTRWENQVYQYHSPDQHHTILFSIFSFILFSSHPSISNFFFCLHSFIPQALMEYLLCLRRPGKSYPQSRHPFRTHLPSPVPRCHQTTLLFWPPDHVPLLSLPLESLVKP